jgi:trimethylamine:corrinoid methyltransferase-like protein
MEHLRMEAHFESDLFDWRDHKSWSEADSRSLLERAWEKACHIVEDHEVPPLEEKLERELDSIVAAANKELLA